MIKRYRSIFFIMGIVLLILIVSIGIYVFSNSEGIYSENKVENQRRIASTYMTMNNPFFEVINEEIRYIVEGNGDILITRDPALDIEKQIQEIYDFIDLDVKAIFINTVDWIAIKPALEAANKSGITVIAIDADVYDEDLVDCTVVSDNYEAGVLCAKDLMSKRDNANIILLEHNRVKSAIDRINGFKDTIEKNDNYKIVAAVECEGQLEIAMPIVDEILDKTNNVDAIMSLNDPSALGAIIALEKNNLNNVLVYGVDGSPDAKNLIKDSRMTATASQFPREIGRIAGENLYSIFNGNKVDKKVVVSVELIDSNNVSYYDIDDWQ